MKVLKYINSTQLLLQYLSKYNDTESRLALALEDLRRKQFFEGLNADFNALRAREEDWQDELSERKLWEGTLLDDLNDE